MKKSTFGIAVLVAGVLLSGCDDQRTRTVIVPQPAPVVQQYSDGGSYSQPVVVAQAPSTVVVHDNDNGMAGFAAGALIGSALSSGGRNTTVINHYGNGYGGSTYRSGTVINRNTTIINRPATTSTTTRTTTTSGFFGSRSSSSTFKSAPSRSSSFSSRSSFSRSSSSFRRR